MRPWLKWTLRALLALIVVGAATYWWLLLQMGSATGSYRLDLDRARQLADSLPGAKPTAIRVEQIGVLNFPGAVIETGGSWRIEDLDVFSYQIVFPDRTMVVDTGFDGKTGEAMNASAFDQAAFDRMSAALAKAAFIVVTHEHPDHLGGLVTQPNLATLLEHCLLTSEQLADAKALEPLKIPRGRPMLGIGYESMDALLPGVVAIKAPGHTPGSQMIFVRTADGVEYLLTGDVAWKMRNIDDATPRPRLYAILGNEDRPAVQEELDALRRMKADNPVMHIVPGHDGEAVRALIASGAMAWGFQ